MATYIPPVLPGDPGAMRAAAKACRAAADTIRTMKPKVAHALPKSAFSGPAAPRLRTRLGDASDDLTRAAAQLDNAADDLDQQAKKVAASIEAHDAAVARARAEQE